MDRKALIGYVLLFVVFVVFYYLNKQNLDEIEKNNLQDTAITKVDSSFRNEPVKNQNNNITEETAVNELKINSPTPDSLKIEYATLENELLKLRFSSLGANLDDAYLTEYESYKDYKKESKKSLHIIKQNFHQLDLSIPFNGQLISTAALNFEREKTNSKGLISYIYRFDSSSFLRFIYQLKDNYRLDFTIESQGLSDNISRSQNYFLLKRTAAMINQEKTLESEQENSGIYYKYIGDRSSSSLSSEDTENLNAGLSWVGFKQKFFNTSIINEAGFDEDAKIELVEIEDENNDSIIKIASVEFTLPYNHQPTEIHKLSFYIGPNHYQILKKQGVGMESIIPLGPVVINWINKYVVIPLFNILDDYFMSYGLVILILTLIIKLALFPLTYKSYLSMGKMRVLKPELDQIKEKHEGNMQVIQQESMKLYRKAGVNPAGGCIPMLIQMPILFAMFRFFPASIELRHKKLWWTDDLSTFDSIWNFGEVPLISSIYGDHVSLFTLLMTISTFIYTYYNNQISGASGQMKYIGYLMPIMFLGFFNSYPGALSYYYFLSNMITFGQNFAIRKFIINDEKLHKKVQDQKKKNVKMKKSKWQQRLEDAAKKRGIDPYSAQRKK